MNRKKLKKSDVFKAKEKDFLSAEKGMRKKMRDLDVFLEDRKEVKDEKKNSKNTCNNTINRREKEAVAW